MNEQKDKLLINLVEPGRIGRCPTLFFNSINLLFENGQIDWELNEERGLGGTAAMNEWRKKKLNLFCFWWVNGFICWGSRRVIGEFAFWSSFLVVGYGLQRSQCSATKEKTKTNRKQMKQSTKWEERNGNEEKWKANFFAFHGAECLWALCKRWKGVGVGLAVDWVGYGLVAKPIAPLKKDKPSQATPHVNCFLLFSSSPRNAVSWREKREQTNKLNSFASLKKRDGKEINGANQKSLWNWLDVFGRAASQLMNSLLFFSFLCRSEGPQQAKKERRKQMSRANAEWFHSFHFFSQSHQQISRWDGEKRNSFHY